MGVKKTKSISSKAKKRFGVKAPFPQTLSPMLATLVDKPFEEEGWEYEIKWDGYRAIAHCNKGKVQLKSRNNKSFDEKFYPVHDALQSLGLNAVFDGEVIVPDKEGISRFGLLQNWRSEADGPLIYYVFDLLWLDGYSLLDLTLEERREKLKSILPKHSLIRMSESYQAAGGDFYKVAGEMKLEGIMAKKADSTYSPGIRSREWLKIKVSQRHEVVIGGFTINEGTSKLFSALLVGVHKNKKFRYIGKIGTGFSDKTQADLMKRFKPLIRKTSSFDEDIDVNKPSRFRPNPPHARVTWLEPRVVCEVSYTEMTSDGVMRHPSFEGLREDKSANQVTEEKAVPAEKLVKPGKTILYKKKILTRTGATDRKTLLNPSDAQQERAVNGHSLKFTNLNKIFWPKEKYTKRDMLNYYYQVAHYILPYLKGRPQSLNRFPNGITGKSFYQKDVSGKVPDWIETFPYFSDKSKHFMLCSDEASLLYMINLGSIEINPWSSTIEKPDNPDWCIIDIDPDKNPFEQVIETAIVTKEVLESANIKSYCKTSGSTGLHIYIPFGAKYDYEISKEFGRLIATLVHERLPKFTSIERATADRRGKIYIDFLQNRPQATLAAPYSLRPKPGATVSMPLHWEEVKKGLKMSDFNIENAMERIKDEGDIFKPVLGNGIDIFKAIKKLEL